MKDQRLEQDTIDFGQALRVLRRRLPLILLCVAVVAGAAFAFSKQQTKEYTATASLDFGGTNAFAQRILGLTPSGSSSQVVEQASNVELVSLGDTATRTARLLGAGTTAAEVRSSIATAAFGESNVVGISATADSPAQAARIANVYAREYVGAQSVANHRAYENALTLVEGQLAELPENQRFGESAISLQNRAQTLRLLDGTHYGNVRLVGQAVPPSSPSSPNTKKNVVIGALVGLLIGLGLTFIFERFERERWIRDLHDLEAIHELPLLGTVPDRTSRSRGGKRDKARLAEAEAFQILRARLRFLGADRRLRTVLVAAPAAGEGGTTVARGLAEAAVRMGSHVLLIDANLRDPALSREFGLDLAQGLTEVLTGAIYIGQVVRPFKLGEAGEVAARNQLNVLSRGVVPAPNTAELLGSPTMSEVLRYASDTYDFVVLDVPPMATQADGLSLLPRVDGVVVVGRIRRGRRDLAEELHQILQISHAPQLGLVANGVGFHHDVPSSPDPGDSPPGVEQSVSNGDSAVIWAANAPATKG